jgi:DNA replication licensing factor MCM7
VLHADVDEALRLMEASKESLRDDDGEGGDGAGGNDADRSDTSRIYRIIKDMAQAGAGAGAGGRRGATRSRRSQRLGRGPDRERDYAEDGDGEEEGGALDVLSMVDIRARVLRGGYTETQLMTTIQEVRLLSILRLWVT